MNFAIRNPSPAPKTRPAPSIVERFAHEVEQSATALRCLADVGMGGLVEAREVRAEADRLDLARRAFAENLAKHGVVLDGGSAR